MTVDETSGLLSRLAQAGGDQTCRLDVERSSRSEAHNGLDRLLLISSADLQSGRREVQIGNAIASAGTRKVAVTNILATHFAPSPVIARGSEEGVGETRPPVKPLGDTTVLPCDPRHQSRLQT